MYSTTVMSLDRKYLTLDDVLTPKVFTYGELFLAWRLSQYVEMKNMHFHPNDDPRWAGCCHSC